MAVILSGQDGRLALCFRGIVSGAGFQSYCVPLLALFNTLNNMLNILPWRQGGLHDTGVAQARNRFIIKAEPLPEDVVGVLPERRRGFQGGRFGILKAQR